ncbi:hypothetical protein B6U79_00545 [Candidatus Bathyarchaeota archaeon ex4484_231]|nr:MAG: hypothetical protein B6U79_00545 [Candidatus Bathyarchaeota archaeon ex4484_231]
MLESHKSVIGFGKNRGDRRLSGTTVAEALVRTLEKLGVKLIFGLPGSQSCPIYDALYSSKITCSRET